MGPCVMLWGTGGQMQPPQEMVPSKHWAWHFTSHHFSLTQSRRQNQMSRASLFCSGGQEKGSRVSPVSRLVEPEAAFKDTGHGAPEKSGQAPGYQVGKAFPTEGTLRQLPPASVGHRPEDCAGYGAGRPASGLTAPRRPSVPAQSLHAD